MATSYTVSGILRRTIDVTQSSAMAKANVFFQMKDRLAGKINDSTFRANLTRFLSAAGEYGAAGLAEAASVIASVIEIYYPSREASVIAACNTASTLMIDLSDNIRVDIYPKWKVEILYKRYTANDGKYFDIIVGYRAVGKYTPTGQLIMQ